MFETTDHVVLQDLVFFGCVAMCFGLWALCTHYLGAQIDSRAARGRTWLLSPTSPPADYIPRLRRALHGRLRAGDIPTVDSEEKLRRANLHFQAALSHMSQGLCLYDKGNTLEVFNSRFCQIYNLDEGDVRRGLKLVDILALSIAAGNHPSSTVDELLVGVERRGHEVATQRLGNGRIVSISHRPVQGGGWVATYEDVTDRHAAEAQITYLAHHDSLTSLSNRFDFNRRLEQELREASRSQSGALLCLDLDRFKHVNDTLGHPVGDSLLRGVADRLRECTGPSDTVARLGGDEFALIVPGVARPEEAASMAGRLIDALEPSFFIDGHSVVVGCSVGVTFFSGYELEADDVFKAADRALYRAKSNGRGTFCLG